MALLLVCSMLLADVAVVRADGDKMIEDTNGDGQITADECYYHLYICFILSFYCGYLSDDLMGLILDSAAFASFVDAVETSPSSYVIATIDASGRVVNSDDFGSFLSELAMELIEPYMIDYGYGTGETLDDIYEALQEEIDAGVVVSDSDRALIDEFYGRKDEFEYCLIDHGEGYARIYYDFEYNADSFVYVTAEGLRKVYYDGSGSLCDELYSSRYFQVSITDSVCSVDTGNDEYITIPSEPVASYRLNHYSDTVYIGVQLFNSKYTGSRYVSLDCSLYANPIFYIMVMYGDSYALSIDAINSIDWVEFSEKKYQYFVSENESVSASGFPCCMVVDYLICSLWYADLVECVSYASFSSLVDRYGLSSTSDTDDTGGSNSDSGSGSSDSGYSAIENIIVEQNEIIIKNHDEVIDKLDENTVEVTEKIDEVLEQSKEQHNELIEQTEQQHEEQMQQAEEHHEETKGLLQKIIDFCTGFFDSLKELVIGLFVPEEEEMKALFDQLNTFFEETFGFLYYPFEFLATAFDIFVNSDSSTGLTLPGFQIMGETVWGDQTYDISSNEVAGSVFEYVRIGTGSILSLAFVDYLRRFFDKRFGGGGN